MYQFQNLKKFKNIVHGISTVKNGSMNIFRNFQTPVRIRKLLKNTPFKNLKTEQIVFAEQVHGSKLKKVDRKHGGSIQLGVDGLVTDQKRLLLTVKTADCLPVLFYDPKEKVIATCHAGFLGIIKGILPKTIDFLKKEFKSKPKNIIIGIGPHISQKNYQLNGSQLIRTERKGQFKKFLKNNKFSLKEAALWQLTQKGVLRKNIEVIDICTFDNPHLFFSHRFKKLNPGYYKEENSMFITIIGLKQCI